GFVALLLYVLESLHPVVVRLEGGEVAGPVVVHLAFRVQPALRPGVEVLCGTFSCRELLLCGREPRRGRAQFLLPQALVAGGGGGGLRGLVALLRRRVRLRLVLGQAHARGQDDQGEQQGGQLQLRQQHGVTHLFRQRDHLGRGQAGRQWLSRRQDEGGPDRGG